MVRPAHESLSIIMNKVMSCFMDLYAIKHQNMAPERQKSWGEAHCIDAIRTVITPGVQVGLLKVQAEYGGQR